LNRIGFDLLFPNKDFWLISKFTFSIFLGQLTPSNLTAYVVNSYTLSVTWDLPSNVNAIDKIYITVTELGQTNRTIQTQSFDNTIKKLDIQINANDPSSIYKKRFFVYLNKYFCFSKVFIQIELYFFLLDVLIVMDKIHQQLNTNSMSICSVSYDFFVFFCSSSMCQAS
jgi:hypothetical protein